MQSAGSALEKLVVAGSKPEICSYAKHCEFYYWRRQTNGCQQYKPPAAGTAYGLGHFVTFDGTRYRSVSNSSLIG